ncbi:MAG TPA: hypothetical protein VKT82_01735 [Ktedonobacterales bacterium]|nr:hypothetical protein [Ktedonobacterales bacterium]
MSPPRWPRLEFDAYGDRGDGGFGFIFMLPAEEDEPGEPPLHHHILFIIKRPGASLSPDPGRIGHARNVLAWFAKYHFPDWAELPLLDPAVLTREAHPQNPPGFGQPGTEHWQWYGTLLEGVRCPSVRGSCELFIGQAMPPGEAWDPLITLEFVNDIARRMLIQIDATSEN